MRIALIGATVACVSYGLKWTSSAKLVARPRDDATAWKLARDKDFMTSVADMQKAAAPHAQEIVQLMSEALHNISEGKALHSNTMLTEIGSKMKSTDILSADAFYIGVELRCENPKKPMTPGWDFEIFFAMKDDDLKVCFALQGGLDYELGSPWGMLGKGPQETELMLAMGGTKFDQLPDKKLKPILEYGGQAKVSGLVMDATVDVDLQNKKTMMVGTEIEIGHLLGEYFSGKKKIVLTKILTPTGSMHEVGFPIPKIEFLTKFNGKHGPIDAELNGGGMICVS